MLDYAMSDTEVSAFAAYNSSSSKSKKKKSKKSKVKTTKPKPPTEAIEQPEPTIEPVEPPKRKLEHITEPQNDVRPRKRPKTKKNKSPRTSDTNANDVSDDITEPVPHSNDVSDDIAEPAPNPVETMPKSILVKSKKEKTFVVENGDEQTEELNFDSVENGKQLFAWVISPSEEHRFFTHVWEKRPLLVKRHCPTYYATLISSEDIDKALRTKVMHFTKNVDITSYTNGQRETHNPVGRAHAPVVWDYYSNGCSIRLLNPQTFFHKIHLLNATLQEFFGCLVGANVYLTPAGTQGFAPHYDDIEAFILQLEGKKHWKLYTPRCSAETLPRLSSGNLQEEDLEPPIAEYTLEAGDMLYFPRGTIHQGHALEDTHSLHLTLSVYQKTSWADLLEKLLPAALKVAVEENIAFRRGLPLQYLSYMGIVHSDETSKERTSFLHHLEKLVGELFKHAPIDAAVDQLGRDFVHDSLPPVLRSDERCRTVFGDGEEIRNGEIRNAAELGLDTRIKLLRYNSLRLVKEDEDTLRLYHSMNNSREYHGEEEQFLEVSDTLAPAVDALIKQYPHYLAIEDLPLDSDIDKVQIASDLWENGLLITEEVLGYTSE